jgi:hypothetical protein
MDGMKWSSSSISVLIAVLAANNLGFDLAMAEICCQTFWPATVPRKHHDGMSKIGYPQPS